MNSQENSAAPYTTKQATMSNEHPSINNIPTTHSFRQHVAFKASNREPTVSNPLLTTTPELSLYKLSRQRERLGTSSVGHRKLYDNICRRNHTTMRPTEQLAGCFNRLLDCACPNVGDVNPTELTPRNSVIITVKSKCSRHKICDGGGTSRGLVIHFDLFAATMRMAVGARRFGW